MELHLFVRWFEFITTWLHLKTNRNRKHVEHSHTHDFCCWMNDAIEWNSSWTNALAENFFPVETEHTRRQMKSESMLDRVLRTNIVSVGYGISLSLPASVETFCSRAHTFGIFTCDISSARHTFGRTLIRMSVISTGIRKKESVPKRGWVFFMCVLLFSLFLFLL